MKNAKPSLEQRIIQGLESFADALEKGDDVDEKFTRRHVVLTLNPASYDSKLVKDTRRILGASQFVFAYFLGVTPSVVQKWERGDRVPSKMACRFMDEIRRDPKLSKERFRDLFRPRTPRAHRGSALG